MILLALLIISVEIKDVVVMRDKETSKCSRCFDSLDPAQNS